MKTLVGLTTSEYLLRGVIAFALVAGRLMLGGLVPRGSRKRD